MRAIKRDVNKRSVFPRATYRTGAAWRRNCEKRARIGTITSRRVMKSHKLQGTFSTGCYIVSYRTGEFTPARPREMKFIPSFNMVNSPRSSFPFRIYVYIRALILYCNERFFVRDRELHVMYYFRWNSRIYFFFKRIELLGFDWGLTQNRLDKSQKKTPHLFRRFTIRAGKNMHRVKRTEIKRGVDK